jgi:Na+/melibiose symporter-like transporter
MVLQLSGFQPNVEQTEGAKLAISGLYAGVPLVLFLAAAVVFRRFTLDQREHARIRSELALRPVDG